MGDYMGSGEHFFLLESVWRGPQKIEKTLIVMMNFLLCGPYAVQVIWVDPNTHT